MSLGIRTLFDKVESHAMALGIFEQVNGHEPKNAPGNGRTAAIWVQNIGPVRGGSGLQITSARLEFTVRIYGNLLQGPEDEVDPVMVDAVDLLMEAYSGDLDLGDTVRNIDLLGQAGEPLSARAGYLDIDGATYRIMDILLPLIVNDVWSQA